MVDKQTTEFVCDAPKCPLAGPEVGCMRWLEECAQGAFRKIVSRFSVYGDWSVHEWSIGSGKFYAKLFGPMGFVTIEDYTWKCQGYTVSVRLRQPRGEAEWRNREDLSAEDESLADAVAWACSLAGIRANEK